MEGYFFMPFNGMLHKSFRLIAAICAFSIGVSQPIPALALRPQRDQSGLEERFIPGGFRDGQASAASLLEFRMGIVRVERDESNAPIEVEQFRTVDHQIKFFPKGDGIVLVAHPSRPDRSLILEERLEYPEQAPSGSPRRVLVVRQGKDPLFSWKGEPGERESVVQGYDYNRENWTLTVYLDPLRRPESDPRIRRFKVDALSLDDRSPGRVREITLRLVWADPRAVVAEIWDVVVQPGGKDVLDRTPGLDFYVNVHLKGNPARMKELDRAAEDFKRYRTDWIQSIGVPLMVRNELLALIEQQVKGRVVLSLPGSVPQEFSMQPTNLYPDQLKNSQSIRFRGFAPASAWEKTAGASATLEFSSDKGKSWKRQAVSQTLPASAGMEESGILWAGDLPTVVPLISGDPRPLLVSLDIYAPGLTRDQLLSSLELILFTRVNDKKQKFPVEPQQMQLAEGWYGPQQNNYRVQVEIPAKVRANLENAGYVRFWFKYHLKKENWGETDLRPGKGHGTGEIVSQPGWLFNSAMYSLNAKAWGSFAAIENRLPELEQLGAKILLLQGIHPGPTAFEIDDYEIADPDLGGEAGLRSLLQEAKRRGFRVVIPFVPGHSSPRNKLLQEAPYLYKQAPPGSPELQTVAVDVNGVKTNFLRGNVYPNGRLPGEIPGGFGPGTVQFDLWDQAKRKELAAYLEKVLGQWVRLGIDGFYADTAHSIHRVAPDWLDGIQRRVRMLAPDTIFGFEAHWLETGGFIARGSSFAQEAALYYDWFTEILSEKKDAAGLTRHLQQMTPALLQSWQIFVQNHDVESIAVLLESSPVAPALRADAQRAIAALLLLGVPGIPLINSGQEIGLKERWNVTGHPAAYDARWNWGGDPDAPAAPLFDPFSDTSSEAQQIRQAYSDLLRIRQANPAFWWADGARFLPTSDPRTFAVYRAAGNRRALVLIRLDTSAQDPEQATPVVVDLSALKLSPLEAASLRESFQKPSLVLPASDSLGWNADAEEENVTSLSVQLKPFQTAILEFEGPLLAAAGMEEPGRAFVFPAPVRWDGERLDSLPVYGQGGKPAPSTGEGFLKTIFKRPGQALLPVHYEVWAQEIPLDLQNGSRDSALDELLSRDYLGQVYLPDAAKSRPEAVQKLLEILGRRSPGLRVHYQIFRRGGGAPLSKTVETRPVSVRLYQLGGTRGGPWQMEIRYEAQVPIDEVADYTFTAEVTVPSVPPSPAPWVSPVIDVRVPPLFRERWPELLPRPMSLEDVPKLPPGPETKSLVLPKPQRFQILQQGWFRVSDGSEVVNTAANIPIGLKQLYLHDGRFLQIALYPPADRQSSWSGTGLGYRTRYLPGDGGTLIRSLVTEAVRAPTYRRVLMGANSSPRAGGVYPDGDLMNLGEVASLLPMNGNDAPIEWIWRSSGQQGISIGIRRNNDRATFVVEGNRGDSEALIASGDRIIALLNDLKLLDDDQLPERGRLPDYNSWISIREDGIMRLHIRPRRPDSNSQHGQPVADQDYRLVRWGWGGRTRLMNAAELEVVGGSHMTPEIDVKSGPLLKRVVIPQGKLILNFAIDTPALLGLILSQKEEDYDNPHLPALMEQGLELASVPWSHPRIEAIRRSLEAEPGNDRESVFEQEKAEVRATWENVRDIQDFIGQVKEVRDAGLRHQEAFNALTPQERNAYTRRFWELLQQFRQDSRVRFEVAPHSEPAGEQPRDNTPQVVALGIPTLDLITEVEGEKRQEILTVRLKAGGFSAHVAQALLAMGVPHHLIAAFGGETGQAARQALAAIPVTEPFEFLTRISIMFPRAGNRVEIRLVSPGGLEPLTPEQIRSFWERIPSVTDGNPPVVVFGERFPGNEQEASAQAWAEGMRQTQAPVYVSVNSSWTPETIGTILSANPRGVFVTPEGLAQAAGRDLSSWRSRPEDMAYLAYQLRRTHQLSGWVLVALPTGGLVLVNDEGWWHVAPSPLHQLTYISGAADTAFATFLEAMLHQNQPVDAAEQAVTASAIFMGRDPAERGLPPTQEEGAGAFTQASWPVIVDALPIPKTVREEQELDLQQRLKRSQEDADKRSADRFLAHLQSRPAAGAAAAEHQAWWQGLSSRLPDAVHALEGPSRRTIMRELLGIADDPGGPSGLRSTARGILSELREQVWEVDVDSVRALPYGRIFHHQAVSVPGFVRQAVWETYLISDELAAAAVNLTEAAAGEMDLAFLAPETVGDQVGDWDSLLRSRRLEGVQISSAALEKLSDPQLVAAFRRRIQEALSRMGGLVIIQDVDVRNEADGQRRLFIYV